jgi:L-seryl-tRNA(Ser) seleniumtransferase
MLSRRNLIRNLSAIPFIGGLLNFKKMTDFQSIGEGYPRDFFKELGVRTFINAAGTYTALTSSLMTEEVKNAYLYASTQFVNLNELHDRIGERLAQLLRCEAAMVTSGAASAITLGTAGVLTGLDAVKIDKIPGDLSGMKSEVIIQKSHRVGYDHAIRNTGIKLIEVETLPQFEKAISEKTAMFWFLNYANPVGQIKDKDFVALGKKYGIPTFNDCAADVPPVENLWKYTDMGFDLVAFSGGKGLQGPQSAGLLLGRKDLILAARANAVPNGNTIGRGMKVNKEEMLSLLVAVENYLNKDFETEWKMWEDQINHIHDVVSSVPGVKTEIHIPEIANHVPSIRLYLDAQKLNHSPDSLRIALRNGHPSIETVGGSDSLDMTTWMLNPGEERIVARRIKEILLT